MLFITNKLPIVVGISLHRDASLAIVQLLKFYLVDMKYLDPKYWPYIITAALAFFKPVTAPPRVAPPALVPIGENKNCGRLLEFQECVKIPNKGSVKQIRKNCATSLNFVGSYSNSIQRIADANHLCVKYSDTEPNRGIFQGLRDYLGKLSGRDKRYLELNNYDMSLTVKSGLRLEVVRKLIEIMRVTNPFSGFMILVDRDGTHSNENGYFSVSLPRGDKELKKFVKLMPKHKKMGQTQEQINSILSEGAPILIHIRLNKIGKIVKADDIKTIEEIPSKRMSRPTCIEDEDELPSQNLEHIVLRSQGAIIG